MNDGAIDVNKHATTHTFRDRNKGLEMTKETFVNRMYQTAKVRAASTENEHKRLYLQSEPYKGMVQAKALRERNLEKEISADFRYKNITDNERISQGIKNQHNIDPTPLDMKKFHFPTWRESKPNKWVTKNGFKNKSTNLGSKKAWQEIPLKLPNQEAEAFVDNYDRQKLLSTHVRSGSLDFDPHNEFTSYTRNDLWDSAQHISQSIRTGVNDNIYKLKPVYDNFNENDHLEFYNQTLVETNNVNRIIPFRHSNNWKGDAFLNLRPMNKRTHPKTTAKQVRVAYLNYKNESRLNNSVDKKDTENNFSKFDLNFHNLMKRNADTKNSSQTNWGLNGHKRRIDFKPEIQTTEYYENCPSEDENKTNPNLNSSIHEYEKDLKQKELNNTDINVQAYEATQSLKNKNKGKNSTRSNVPRLNMYSTASQFAAKPGKNVGTENQVIDHTLRNYFKE